MNDVIVYKKKMLNYNLVVAEIDKIRATTLKTYRDTWFVFGDKNPIGTHKMNNWKNAYCKKASIKQIRLHDFRHTCASLLVNKGANVQVVAKYLGHTKVEETLKTYSHLFTSTLDEVVAVIDNLDNNKTED